MSEKESSRCYDFYKQRKEWDELFNEYNVDLFFGAHIHDYER